MSAPRQAIRPQDHFELRLPSDPQVAADGRFVAFLRTRADLQTDRWLSELSVVDVVTGVQHELGAALQARWSPDAASLALVRAVDAGFAIERWWPGKATRELLATLPQAPSGLAWSPDGRQLAYVMQVAPAAPTAPTVTADDVPDWESLRTEQWSPRSRYTERLVRRVEGVDAELTEGVHHIFLLTVSGGTLRQLTDGPYQHGGPLVEVTKMTLAGRISWTPDGRHLVMSMQRPSPQDGPLNPETTIAADVYEFDVADGTVRRLTDFGGPVCQACVSPDGRWIAFVGFRNERKSFHTNVLHIMPSAGGQPVALPNPQQLEVHQQFQWLPDSSGLLVLVPQAGDGCLVRVSLDGQWTTIARDVGGGAATGYVMYQKGFSVARDGRIAYLSGRPQRSDEVALLAADGGQCKLLTRESAWLEDREVAPIEALWLPVPSSTPKPWQAWLVRPPGVSAERPAPLIVWLHGGPYLAWGPQFAIVPQIWAARGYAVLMINPRGSLGYGEAFTEELQHDFPGADDLHIVDAVDAVVARGGIDSRRIHVAGESAGAVLAGWLIGHDSQRFASAAVIYGVYDWTSQVLSVDRPDYFPYYWLPGAPWDAAMHDQYWHRSPLSRVPHVRTPTLVLCGERDWRTPISQSEIYYTALKLCGVDAALVRYPDENHSLEHHPSHWMDLIEQLDRWFRRYGPDHHPPVE
ncbi:MAG: prolyl oligopeptidase family serine peptidase [Proteobacteria bacterium]|nr:prolyl oligopeptidase family serine peptidase [Pseudomonadota bacterium]